MMTITGNTVTEVFWKMWEESQKPEPEFITIEELLEDGEQESEVRIIQ